jgi:hypothetical protein
MKTALMLTLFSFVITNAALAASSSLTVTSNEVISELGDVPQNLMAVLLDNNIAQVEVKPNVYTMTVENVRCDYLSRDAMFPDSSVAGLASIICYKDAEVERNGSGTKLIESRYLYSILETVEKHTAFAISDCAMGGRCTSFVSAINCQVDLNVEEMQRAYTCQLDQ